MPNGAESKVVCQWEYAKGRKKSKAYLTVTDGKLINVVESRGGLSKTQIDIGEINGVSAKRRGIFWGLLVSGLLFIFAGLVSFFVSFSQTEFVKFTAAFNNVSVFDVLVHLEDMGLSIMDVYKQSRDMYIVFANSMSIISAGVVMAFTGIFRVFPKFTVDIMFAGGSLNFLSLSAGVKKRNLRIKADKETACDMVEKLSSTISNAKNNI